MFTWCSKWNHANGFPLTVQAVSGRERKGREERDKEMEGTDHGSVGPEDPREWSTKKVATFVRSLGPGECLGNSRKFIHRRQAKGQETQRRCGSHFIQRRQQIVKRASENLGRQLESILEQEETDRECD